MRLLSISRLRLFPAYSLILVRFSTRTTPAWSSEHRWVPSIPPTIPFPSYRYANTISYKNTTHHFQSLFSYLHFQPPPPLHISKTSSSPCHKDKMRVSCIMSQLNHSWLSNRTLRHYFQGEASWRLCLRMQSNVRRKSRCTCCASKEMVGRVMTEIPVFYHSQTTHWAT